MAKFSKMPLVEVVWKDATSVSGWNSIQDMAEHMEMMTVRTVGYLIKKDKQAIKLAMSHTEDDSTNIAMVVPAGWLVSYKVLRKA